jgi:hypothetical protein
MINQQDRQEEYNKFMLSLSQLSLDDLLLLYVEAKTGSYENIEKLPLEYQEAVDVLNLILNHLYADSVIDSLSEE